MNPIFNKQCKKNIFKQFFLRVYSRDDIKRCYLVSGQPCGDKKSYGGWEEDRTRTHLGLVVIKPEGAGKRIEPGLKPQSLQLVTLQCTLVKFRPEPAKTPTVHIIPSFFYRSKLKEYLFIQAIDICTYILYTSIIIQFILYSKKITLTKRKARFDEK